jgi:glyoxylase-like metal-dependent hydrolase (beta-lactamase superfamily II)
VKELAPGVWRVPQFPGPMVNVYVAGDVLIDAGARTDRGRITKAIEGRDISMLALTHVHPDHQGCAKEICDSRQIPLACHAEDVDAMEGRRPVQEAHRDHPVNRLIKRIWEGPPRQVDRVLGEGDDVAGFRVVHAPGHARGEVIFFRDSDGVAICGDVIRNISYATGLPGIKEPPKLFTYDPAENRRSIRKLADLGPKMILAGHGPPVTDISKFERFVNELPGN